MVQLDPIQSYLNLKIGLPPDIRKAGSYGIFLKITLYTTFLVTPSKRELVATAISDKLATLDKATYSWP